MYEGVFGSLSMISGFLVFGLEHSLTGWETPDGQRFV